MNKQERIDLITQKAEEIRLLIEEEGAGACFLMVMHGEGEIGEKVSMSLGMHGEANDVVNMLHFAFQQEPSLIPICQDVIDLHASSKFIFVDNGPVN